MDLAGKTLTIYDQCNGKKKEMIELDSELLKVETGLSQSLPLNFRSHFREDVKNLKLPKDNPLPFVLYFRK